jgi:hypothetical protein
MHSIESLLLAALPRMSREGQKAVTMLARSCGAVARTDEIAEILGLRNRHALMRLLRDEGLPSYRELAGWIQVLAWQLEWENEHTSLARQASNVGRYAGSVYRTVRRVTGADWGEVQARGSHWVLLQLLARCVTPTATHSTAVSA